MTQVEKKISNSSRSLIEEVRQLENGGINLRLSGKNDRDGGLHGHLIAQPLDEPQVEELERIIEHLGAQLARQVLNNDKESEL